MMEGKTGGYNSCESILQIEKYSNRRCYLRPCCTWSFSISNANENSFHIGDIPLYTDECTQIGIHIHKIHTHTRVIRMCVCAHTHTGIHGLKGKMK